MELSDCKRIFVRGPNWLGDVVMATRVFARIRAGFPDAHLVCGMRPNLLPLLSNTPYFDDFVELPHAKGVAGRWSSFWAQVRKIRAGRYDLAILLPNSPSTGWTARLAGVPRRLGYKQGRPFTITHGLHAEKNRGVFARRVGPRRVPTPMPEYWGELLDLIGVPPVAEGPTLHTSAAEVEWVESWLQEHGVGPAKPLVLFNPGANFGPSKLWVPDRWVELARHYQAQGCATMFLAGPNETDMVAGIAGRADALWACVPLEYLKALIARARLVVSTDTGPRHLAVALGVPAVCLMGPNDSRYTDFALDRQVVLQKTELACVPCQRKVCPLGHHECMQSISVREVVEAADGLVARLGA